jgi:adenylate cyclase
VSTSEWEEAGLYQPDAPGADERKALLEYLTERGATLERMMEAHQVASLPGVAGELALGPKPPTISVEELAATCGVPEPRVRRILLAAGLPVSDGDGLPDDIQTVVAGFEQGSALMGEDAILAFTRVLGAAATNVAEAAVALFYSELGPGSEREGPDELTRARQSEQATLAFQVVPGVLSHLLRAQFERAIRRAALSRWSPTPADGTAPPATAGSTEVVALGFVDLVGSTAWADEQSLRDQSLALSRFESAAWSSAVLAGGRVIKMIGDEVFFAAPSVDAACGIGTEVCHAAAADPVLPPARGAIGYGGVIAREGDYFGPLVNVVSRLTKAAAPGELVVTEEAAARLGRGRWVLRALEPQRVRGLDRAVAVSSVHPPAIDLDHTES